MAERGGARRPKDRTPKAPGVGRNSKRTDTQLIATPSVQESDDLQVGDRERIRQMQRTQPLSATSLPRVLGAPGGGALLGVGGQTSSQLPQHLVEMPTNRPLEPETTGLPFGPGGGPEALQSYQEPDDRQLILRFLARGGNEDANRILSGMVDSQRPAPPEVAPLLSSAEDIEEIPEEAVAEESAEGIAPEELPPEEPNVPEEAVME